jgi:hypothetical protein
MLKMGSVKIHNPKKGQSFIEYTFTVVITVAVLVVMGNYFSRGLQGKLKESVDPIGEEFFREVPLPEGSYRVSGVTGKPSMGHGIRHASSAMSKGTFSYVYEGERGFVVTTRTTGRNQVGVARGIVYPSEVPPLDVTEPGEPDPEILERLYDGISGWDAEEIVNEGLDAGE